MCGAPQDRGPAQRRRLLLTLLLVLAYMVAEAIGGWVSGSLALLADAGHMFSDAAALALSLFASVLASRPPSARRTFGYYRGEILAALANGALLGAIALLIFWEALHRLADPPTVQAPLAIAVAGGGLAVNLLGLWVLGGDHDNLNVRAAWLHVLSDALGSVGAIVAGLLILGPGWGWADPVASLLIGVLVVVSAWRLLRETVSVLMQSVPIHLDIVEIRTAVLDVPGVVDVHDLHVWTITSGVESLTGHVVVRVVCHREELLRTIRERLHDRFGIDHITIQIEPEGFEEHHPLPV